MKSEHARCAKQIKIKLKHAFPTVEFSVKSSSFAGGNSVDVTWHNGPTSEQVAKITHEYQYGHFDGMTDSYEYSNTRKDIPQTKYLHLNRFPSDAIKEQVFQYLKRTHDGFEHLNDMLEHSDILMNEWNVWRACEYIYRILGKVDLTNGWDEKAYEASKA
jgi:hypothetical protein